MSTKDDPTISALTIHFGDISPLAIDELSSMLRLYNISSEDLYFKWEAYCIKMRYDHDVEVSVDHVRDFKRDAQQMLEAEVRGKRGAGGGASGVGGGRLIKAEVGEGADRLGLFGTPKKNTATKRKIDRAPFETPSSKKYAANDGVASSPLPVIKVLSISQPPPITPFSKRPTPLTVRETLNAHLPKPTSPATTTTYSTRVDLAAIVELKKFSYRPMHQKQYESSETLDDRIEAFLSLISESCNIPFDEFSDPSAASPGDIVAVGRICTDSVADGRLNEASLVLESCRRVGAGSRIPLKFDKLEKLPESLISAEGTSISLFPGQIIALRGVNPNGKFLSVKEIIEMPRMPNPASIKPKIKSFNQKCPDGLRVMLAAGPYTTHDNLDFEPLSELCQRARETKPDVLILLGPFIDIDHPMVAEGDFDLDPDTVDPDDATLEDLFRQRISTKISLVDQVSTLVILIPSTRDAFSKHISYPQEPFPKKNLDLGINVKCLPNPALFSLNEIVFAASTADALFDICRSQVLIHPTSLPPPQQTPLAISIPPTTRAIRHILTQRTFYPVFPPPATAGGGGGSGSRSAGPPLDLAYLRLSDFHEILPDILILPSQLDAFARGVDSVVAVNPGWVCRKAGYGTFVEMCIGPRGKGEGEEEEEEGVVVKHRVWERARVEVIRV